MSLYLGENLISGQATLVGESRNIGQIIPSAIPLTDAGLHLLDGALIQGDGIYSAFVTYIAGLVSTYPNLFVTESAWQTAVTTYGVCGKFVYNSTNNTVRLPKVTGIIEGTTDLTALGDLVEAGLPNIVGNLDFYSGGGTGTGAITYTKNSGNNNPGGGNMLGNCTLNFNASRSSAIYGNSTTVQPQTIKVLYYIVIATSTKTDIEVDIDTIATDLNGKADRDLSNITPSTNAKNIIMGTCLPNYSASIVLSSSSFPYTAPSNGIVYVAAQANQTNFLISVNNIGLVNFQGTNSYYGRSGWVLVSRGDVVTYSSSGFDYANFIPLKGEQ